MVILVRMIFRENGVKKMGGDWDDRIYGWNRRE